MSAFEVETTVRTRRAALLAVPAAIAGVALLVWFLSFFLGAGLAFPAGVAWNAGALLFLIALVTNPFARARQATVRADEAGLHANGELLMPRAAMKRAYLQPRPTERSRVRIRGTNRLDELEVEVPSLAAGRALLGALRLDAAHAAMTFRTASLPIHNRAAQFAIAGVMVAAMQALGALHLYGAISFPFALLPLLYWPTTVIVGADGVRVSWLGVGSFYSYADIVAVGSDEDGVELTLTNGKTVHIQTRWRRRGTVSLLEFFTSPLRDAIVERIEQARIAFRSGPKDADAAAFLRPGSREIRTWVRETRALGAGRTASFRTAEIPEEHLWHMLENPALDDEARAGAAVALSSVVDDEGRARLRVAAEATVSPKIRVAIEAAADDDEERMAEAVLALDRIDPPRARGVS